MENSKFNKKRSLALNDIRDKYFDKNFMIDEKLSLIDENLRYWYIVMTPRAEIASSLSQINTEIVVWDQEDGKIHYTEPLQVTKSSTGGHKTHIHSIKILNDIVFLVIAVEKYGGGVIDHIFIRAYSSDLESIYFGQSDHFTVDNKGLRTSSRLLINEFDNILPNRDNRYLLRFQASNQKCHNFFFTPKQYLDFDEKFLSLGTRYMSDKTQTLFGVRKLQIKYCSEKNVKLDVYSIYSKGEWKNTFSFISKKNHRIEKLGIEDYRSMLKAGLRM